MNVSAPVATPDRNGMAPQVAAPPDPLAELRVFAPFLASRPGKGAEASNSFQSLFGCLLPEDAGEPADRDAEATAADETKAAPLLLMPVSPAVTTPPLSLLPGASPSTKDAAAGTESTAAPAAAQQPAAGWLAMSAAPNTDIAMPAAFGEKPEAPHVSRLPFEAIVRASASDGPRATQPLAFAARLVPSAQFQAAGDTEEAAHTTSQQAASSVPPAIADPREAQAPAAAKKPASPAVTGPADPEPSVHGAGDEESGLGDLPVRPASAVRTAEENPEPAHGEPHPERTDGPTVGDKTPRAEIAAFQNNAAAQPALKSTEHIEASRTREAPAPRPAEADSHTTPIRQAAPVASPARDISLHVAAEGRERVELRVTDRAGELRVAVRTADPDLAGALRENLPQLVQRLERSGFEAETWRPAQSASASFDHRHTPRAGTSDSSADTHHGHPQHQGEQRDRRQQQPERSRWVEEIDHSLTPASERTPWLHP